MYKSQPRSWADKGLRKLFLIFFAYTQIQRGKVLLVGFPVLHVYKKGEFIVFVLLLLINF